MKVTQHSHISKKLLDSVASSVESVPSVEVFYTPEEVARKYRFHPSLIRKLFIDQPGVIRFGHPGKKGRRQYYTLRIPPSVVMRVFGEMTVTG